MKILLVTEEDNRFSMIRIGQKLRKEGHQFDVFFVDVGGAGPKWKELSDCGVKYDFQFLSADFNNHYGAQFLERNIPTVGRYLIPHDLLTGAFVIPEKTLAVAAFHNLHLKFIEQQGVHPLICQWPKLYAKRIKSMADPAAGSNAVIIGSRYVNRIKPFLYKDFFTDVYYKPRRIKDIHPTCTNIEQEGTHVIASLPLLAKTWFTVQSSAFVEALMFHCLPILWGTDIVFEQKVTSLISRVGIKKIAPECDMNDMLFNAVTTRDMEYKLPILLDEDERAAVVQQLRDDWIGEGYSYRPQLEDALMRHMEMHA